MGDNSKNNAHSVIIESGSKITAPATFTPSTDGLLWQVRLLLTVDLSPFNSTQGIPQAQTQAIQKAAVAAAGASAARGW